MIDYIIFNNILVKATGNVIKSIFLSSRDIGNMKNKVFLKEENYVWRIHNFLLDLTDIGRTLDTENTTYLEGLYKFLH